MSNGEPPNPQNQPTPGQPSFPQPAPAPAPYYPPPEEKSSAKFWIIGGCGCTLLLALLACATIAILYFIGKNAQEKERANGSGGSSGSGSGTSSSSGSGMTFTSTPENIPADLRDRFVPFQFTYPATFKVKPATGGNFVKIEESMVEGGVTFTMENFAVGYVTLPSAEVDNNTFYPQLLSQLSGQFASSFEKYRELGQVSETVAGNRGRAMAFQAAIGDTPVFGRAILVREPTNSRGVALILLATPKDPAIKSVGDVGVKGDLADILASFKFLPTSR